ncbi:hypothetical protein OG357_03760 [Streptomyces sp. NBC_01255]|uniref:hypothetical protein n=1 Tax=Streptomyces sp. NBC_01255 TaxID=2903798 RepID=UPI002E370B58|nr:hypothetical protein [Streptomyces sp. NBC_01255]
MDVGKLRKRATELRFTPRKPVRWLAPTELSRTAVKVGLAAVFADYADKREIQGALRAGLLQAPLAHPDAGEIWIDFVADLGDGFEATYSVASALAAPELAVSDAVSCPRGSLLVLGGDQVYPVASTTAYEDRLKGPYRAALPSAPDQPLMVALPGNHDWYDGLTAFLRTFAQERCIGGWQTRQTRSYFAVRLPRRWWLVGLDSQLGSYIDDPQRRYFETCLSPRLLPGDSVIVCSAAPTWIKSHGDPDSFNTLHWFDRNFIRTRLDRVTGQRVDTGASIRLWLTGDKHHYARYEERLPDDPPTSGGTPPTNPRRRQMVTCGLGGAFLSSTHRLPNALSLPPATSRLRKKDDPPAAFALSPHTYPTAQESRSLARRIANPFTRYWLGWRNPGFAGLAGVVQLVLVLLMSGAFALAAGRRHPVDAIRSAGAYDVIGMVGVCVFLFILPFVLGWGRRPAGARPPRRMTGPIVATLLQLAVAAGVLAVTVTVVWALPPSWFGLLRLAIPVAVIVVTGAFLGSAVFALWVLLTHHGLVADWQMSGQSVDDRTGFVRMHIAPDGTLTLYPLALQGTCRDWRLDVVADTPTSWVRPVPGTPPTVRLIEDPVVIARHGGRAEISRGRGG